MTSLSTEHPRGFCTSIFVIFMLYVLFMMSLIGQSKLDGGDDYHHIAIASSLQWSDILRALPILPVPNTSPSGVEAHALSDRIGQTLMLKVQYELFENEEWLYYLFQVTTGGICMALLAIIVFWITHSVLISLMAAFLYFFFPPAFLHNAWLSDFAEFVHLLTLISLILMGVLYHRRDILHVKMNGVDIALYLLIATIGYFGAICKSSGFIIAYLFYLYIIYEHGIKRLVLAMPMRWTVWCVLAVLPITIFLFVFENRIDWDSLIRMLWMNDQNEFESEKTLAAFNLNSVLPVSLARNLGFFFIWAWAASIVLLLIKRKLKIDFRILFVSAWLMVEIFLLALFPSHPRYLTEAWLPLCILFSLSVHNIFQIIQNIHVRRILFFWLLAGLLFNSINNFQHNIFLRNWKMSYFNQLSTPALVVWNDLRDNALNSPADINDLVRFAWPGFVIDVQESMGLRLNNDQDQNSLPSLPEVLAFSNIRDMHTRRFNPNAAEQMTKEYGRSYGILQRAESPDTRYVPIAKIQKNPPAPLLDILGKVKKKRNDDEIVVYKRVFR